MVRSLTLGLIAICAAVQPAWAEELRVESETASESLLSDIQREIRDSGAADTLFEARRQARNAARKSENYLNSIGYFAPEISYTVDAGPPYIGRVSIEPGPLFTLAEIGLDTGADPLPDQAQTALQSVRTLASGDVAKPESIYAEEAALIAALKAVGYADATAQDRVVIGDREAGTLDMTYRIMPGPRIRLGQVIYPSDARTRRDYLTRLIPYVTNEIYTPEKLADLNRRLNATRNYRFVSVQLAAEARQQLPSGDEVRDVVVQLEERARYTLTSGTSYSTTEGPGLAASLTRRNATRRGDTLTGGMTLAELERSFSVDWRIPNITGFDRSLVLSSELGREETDAFDREAVTVSGTFEVRQSDHLTYALGASSEFTREEDAFEQRDQQILSTSLGVRLDYADDPLDATSGWRVDARGEPGVVIGDREAQFFSLNGQISAYQPLDQNKRIVAAARVRSGFVFGAALSDLPVSRRFFAGGGGSARGFEYQSVGPEDADGTPTGGRGLLEMSGEMRWRRDGPLGFVAFLDGTTVSADQGVEFGDLRYSAGLGVRYDTLVGPIRLDLATPIDPDQGDDPIQVYVSIGQAF
ncbi:MAG: BamA/TamA family outer membrane protein [Henriciella sp.]|nr:BamA/TamA family outer membrane protein [Henriciella sp.]